MITRVRPTEAFRDSNLFDRGMGYVTVARFKADGRVEAGTFLVDMFCLGVKNAFFSKLSAVDYEQKLLARMFPDGGQAMTPASARKLVEDAVAYAAKLGLRPHADYKLGARVFGGIDPSASDEEFVFGKDGKPLFFPSPHDSPAQVRRIMRTLGISHSCGDPQCGHDHHHH